EVRADRRCKELMAKGQKPSFEKVLAEIRQRDYQDTHRAIAPLKMAKDSVKLDTSEMNVQEVLAELKRIIGEKVPL
ncbi:MAG: (d)CMP kinase, partial [Clostridiales bacterium]|nr:(d)CMP kinase [Clostridiales bacterium]